MNPHYEVIDDRFRDLIEGNAALIKIADGCLWTEGPVYFRDSQMLLWSDIPNNRIMRWIDGVGVSVYRADSNFANGNTRDREGRLVSCEHGRRRVTRTELDGTITVIAENYQGKRLNSPNDVVVKSDGTISGSVTRPTASSVTMKDTRQTPSGTIVMCSAAIPLVASWRSSPTISLSLTA